MKAITTALMLVSAFATTSAQAIPVTINYTVDNTILDFGICENLGCSPLTGPSDFSTLFPTGSNQSNWANADSYTFDLAPGTYEFGFRANNFGTGSRRNPAGLLAEILWDGNQNLSSSDWDVTTNGIDYVSSTEWAQNGTGIWGNKLIGEISSDAQWLWSANNFNGSTDNIAGFRTTITVPAPATLAIFALGLIGLALRRKKSA
jgi:hypothetical protein